MVCEGVVESVRGEYATLLSDCHYQGDLIQTRRDFTAAPDRQEDIDPYPVVGRSSHSHRVACGGNGPQSVLTRGLPDTALALKIAPPPAKVKFRF